MSEGIDIGHGVSIEIRRFPDDCDADIAGKIGGIAWWHDCGTKYPQREDWMPVDDGTLGWKIEQLEPLTISPSVLCMVCNRHGFIRDGRWVPA